MNLNLTGKTALVCGASQGLGAAVAYELALLGANVVLLSRNADKLATVTASLPNNGSQHHIFIVSDTSKTDDVKHAVGGYLAAGNTIHILVNNTGGPPAGPLLNTPATEMETAFRSHLVTSHTLV